MLRMRKRILRWRKTRRSSDKSPPSAAAGSSPFRKLEVCIIDADSRDLAFDSADHSKFAKETSEAFESL